MPEGNGGRIPPMNLSTVIVIVTMLAGLAGTWSVMGERIANLTEDAKEMRAHIHAVDSRLVSTEREFARMEERLENLRDSLNDLRQRQ